MINIPPEKLPLIIVMSIIGLIQLSLIIGVYAFLEWEDRKKKRLQEEEKKKTSLLKEIMEED